MEKFTTIIIVSIKWSCYNKIQIIKTGGKLSMKKLLVLLMSASIAISSTIVSFAGEWKQDNVGWWYQNDDSSYPISSWKEIDGKQYYFDASGYMLQDTTTPDGYAVGSDGAWINGSGESTSANTNKKTNIDKYQGAAFGIDKLLNELINPNSLFIKQIYYTDSSSGGKQGWYLVCSAQNQGGGYSMCYNTMSVKDDGTLIYYISSLSTQTAESMLESNFQPLEIDKCIAAYNAQYNQNRTISH